MRHMRKYGGYSHMWGRWGSVDEVSFGQGREIRLPSRYRRALGVTAAVVAAAAVTAGAALAVTATGARGAQQCAAQRECAPAAARDGPA